MKDYREFFDTNPDEEERYQAFKDRLKAELMANTYAPGPTLEQDNTFYLIVETEFVDGAPHVSYVGFADSNEEANNFCRDDGFYYHPAHHLWELVEGTRPITRRIESIERRLR
jgi:hypothetical protein